MYKRQDENGTLWIRTSRKKTKVEYEVPLLEVPLHILNKYRDVEPNGKLLPCLLYTSEKYKLTDIPFTALDRSFIEKYDLHLRTDCHLALGTIVHLTTCLLYTSADNTKVLISSKEE